MYQFQSWAQFRGKAAARGGDDLAALKQCERVWNVLSVLNYLRFLADKSGIAAELSAPGAQTAYLLQSTGKYIIRGVHAGVPAIPRICLCMAMPGCMRTRVTVK